MDHSFHPYDPECMKTVWILAFLGRESPQGRNGGVRGHSADIETYAERHQACHGDVSNKTMIFHQV